MNVLLQMITLFAVLTSTSKSCDDTYADTLWLCDRACQLQRGLQALRPSLSTPEAVKLSQAVISAADAYTMDPWDLVGVAANESDLYSNTVGPDGYDCGITQIRTLYSHYDCETLKARPDIAFREAAAELSRYAKRCDGRDDFDRCVFNTYNSGTRYATSGFHGRYWMRVKCFAERARRGESGQGCRKV